ncbi:MAG: acyl-CoA synthetase [SAR324 cluster bacterium]|nr:acyl-CoA synthetase [SAR324 cluster bacterium]
MSDIPSNKLFNITQYCLENNAVHQPEKTALIFASDNGEDERWTFRDFYDAVQQMAMALRSFHLPRFSRVMIRLDNTTDYALAFFASIAAELVPLPASPLLTTKEVVTLLNDAEARMVITATPFSLPDGKLSKDCQVVDIEELTSKTQHGPSFEAPQTHFDDPAFLIYTSGTTSTPKGVLHAQRNAWGRRPMIEGWSGLTHDDIVLHAGQLNWTYTLGVGLIDTWSVGATTVLYHGEKNPMVWPILIEKYKVTVFATVPTLYRQILKYGHVEKHDLSSLRYGLTAGEPLPPTLLDAWREQAGTELYEALGMSEISTYISSSPSVPTRPGCPGKPQKGRNVTILPIEGGEEPLPPGKIGLLAIHRSDPGLMLGYWKREEEEKEVFRGEWFIGGDLAQIDEDGYVWYHGRNNDLMNTFGYRTSPLEIESVFMKHPQITEVGVTEITVSDDVAIIAAFVVPKGSDSLDKEELMSWVNSQLAVYKRPKEIRFVQQLPHTSNGKIIRRKLGELEYH